MFVVWVVLRVVYVGGVASGGGGERVVQGVLCIVCAVHMYIWAFVHPL